MLRLVPILLVGVALTGCATQDPPQQEPDPQAPGPFLPVGASGLSCPAPCERVISDLGDHFEPHVAVDPTDGRRILASSTVFTSRLDGQGPTDRWLQSHFSSDGGSTWETRRLPGGPTDPLHPLAACTEMADNVVTFTRDGDPVFTGLGIAPSGLGRDLFAMQGDGVEWPQTNLITRGAGVVGGCSAIGSPPQDAKFFENPDKPMLTRAANGTLWLVYTAIQVDEGGFRYPLYQATSHDGGATWSEAAPLIMPDGPSGAGAVLIGAAPAIGSDGTYAVAFVEWDSDPSLFVAMGSDPTSPFTVTELSSTFVDWPGLTSTAQGFALVAPVPYDGGRAPMAWRYDGTGWEEQGLLGPGGEHPLATSIATDGSGTIYVTWLGPELRYLARAYVTDWSETVRLDSTPIPHHDMALSGLGHYLGLAGGPDGAFATWVAGAQPERVLVGASLRGSAPGALK